jgi:hypothetical protein
MLTAAVSHIWNSTNDNAKTKKTHQNPSNSTENPRKIKRGMKEEIS